MRFRYRCAIVCHDISQAISQLSAIGNGESDVPYTVISKPQHIARPIVFVFSGQGGQWWNMARDLLDKSPVFYSSMQQCASILEEIGDIDLMDELNKSEKIGRAHV